MRGLTRPEKRAQTLAHLLQNNIDVAILTETWLNTRADISDNNFQIVKSPPCAHQGVAIAFKRQTFQHVKILHQDLHTNCTIAIHLKSHQNPRGEIIELIIVGHYT